MYGKLWSLVSFSYFIIGQLLIRPADRRSQYFLSHSNVSNSDLSENSESDPEACILPTELYHADGVDTPSDRTIRPQDSLFEWDNEDCSTPMQIEPSQQIFTRSTQRVGETAPLLRKSTSFSGPPSRSYSSTSIGPKTVVSVAKKDIQLSTPIPVSKSVATQHDFGGKSTFGQTVSHPSK